MKDSLLSILIMVIVPTLIGISSLFYNPHKPIENVTCLTEFTGEVNEPDNFDYWFISGPQVKHVESMGYDVICISNDGRVYKNSRLQLISKDEGTLYYKVL